MRKRLTCLMLLLALGVAPAMAADDRGVPDDAALELIDLVRQGLKAAPERDFVMPRARSRRLSQPDTAQVSVTVFTDQAPSVTVVRSGGSLAEAAMASARTIIGLPSSLFYAFDESDRVAVLVEVEVGRRTIWPVPALGRTFGDFEPGVDGLLLEFAGNPARQIAPKKVYRNAYEMVVAGLAARDEVLKDLGDQVVVDVDRLNRRTTLGDVRAWNADAVKLSALRVVQFAQVRKGARLLRLRRLLPAVAAVDGPSLERAVVEATDFLQSIRRLVPVPGQKRPQPGILEKYSSTRLGRIPVKRPTAATQARAMAAFAAAWRLTRRPPYRESVEAIRSTLANLTATYEGKPCFAGSDGELPETRATAEVALALLASGDPGQMKGVLAGCGEFLLAMRRKDAGGFHQRYHVVLKQPMDHSSGDTGVALLALHRLGKRLDEKRFVEAALDEAGRLVDHRLAQLAANKPTVRPDEMALFAELASVDKRYERMLEAGTGLLSKQQFADKSPFPQYVGTFRWYRANRGYNLTAQHSADCIGALTASLRARRAVGGDVGRLRTDLARAVRFLLQLRFTEETAFYCPNPEAVAGAMRRDLMDPDVTTDELARAVIVLAEAAELLGPEARFRFPEADLPEGY